MRLAKGTRAKNIHPFFNYDRIGDVFEVVECGSESITLNRCYSDSRSYLHASYTLPTEKFSDFFEVIGMEKPKKDEKNVKTEAIIGDYTETELDVLWNAANYSYEDFKKMLKLSVKWCDKDQKKLREWAGPHHEVMSGVEYYISKPKNKSWKIKVCNDGYVGIASCHPDDNFVISTGVELAAARARRKKAKAEHLAALKKIEETREEMMDAIKCENLIIGKIYHGGEK